MQIVAALNSVRRKEGLPPVQETKSLTADIVEEACRLAEEDEYEEVEKDEFDKLDEMFLSFNNKMIEIKDKLKEENEAIEAKRARCNEKMKTILQREIDDMHKRSDLNKREEYLNKKAKEFNDLVESCNQENDKLKDENKRLRTEIIACNEAVQKFRDTVFFLYSFIDEFDENNPDANLLKNFKQYKEARMKTPEETEEELVAKMLQEPEEQEEDNQIHDKYNN